MSISRTTGMDWRILWNESPTTITMKRRISIRARTPSLSFLQISPSKRRTLRKRSLPLTTSRVVSPGSSNDGSSNNSAATLEEVHSADDECDPYQSGNESSHMKRQQRLTDHWSEVREQLLHAAVECEIPTATCILCKDPADIKCMECGSQAVYCANCTEAVHSTENIFHIPQHLKDGMLQPFSFKQPRILRLKNHSCSSGYMKEVVCVDQKGFQHLVNIWFCACEPEAVTLVRHEMWPATPSNPLLAFHHDLLLWMEALILEGCIGVDSFCRALEYKCGKRVSRKLRNIYPVIIDSFEEFRYQLSSLQFLSPDLNTTNICPACPSDGGTQIVSMDALFGLCRKKSAGVSVRPPLFAQIFFEDQEKVDEFVATYNSSDAIMDKGCHDFLAGDVLRSKSRFAALEETGVFGSICRHQFPLRFFNMKHGERLAYPVYLLEKLQQQRGVRQLLVLYDIACILEKHLRNRGQLKLLENTTLGVPIFHVYGHGAFCQFTYSPRVLTNCGLTDGEGTERLWSYLRRLARITKEMRPSHRIDVLTSALLHYSAKVCQNLGPTLTKRLKHAEQVRDSAIKELATIEMNSNGSISEATIADIAKQHRMSVSQSHSTTNFGQRHKTFQDVLLLARERKTLLLVKARYADGQSIATRLAKRISRSTDSLKRALTKYNAMTPDILEGTSYRLPERLNWELVANVEMLTSLEVHSIVTSPTMPTELSAKIARAVDMKKRAEEELRILKEEICQIVDFYTREHSLIKQHIDHFLKSTDSLSCFKQGCLNLLYHRLLSCEITLTHFSRSVISDQPIHLPKLSLVMADDIGSELESVTLPTLPDEEIETDSSDSGDEY